MPYTFQPKEKYAKAFGNNLRISTKASVILCRVIRKKPLKRARRLLNNLLEQRQSLEGKYYTKAARQMLMLLSSCEKNAEFQGLEADRLFVYASASMGPNVRRRRRKAGFGSKMKMTKVEIMLVERGKQPADKVSKKKIHEQKSKKPVEDGEKKEMKSQLDSMKEKQHETEKKVHELQKAEAKHEQ